MLCRWSSQLDSQDALHQGPDGSPQTIGHKDVLVSFHGNPPEWTTTNDVDEWYVTHIKAALSARNNGQEPQPPDKTQTYKQLWYWAIQSIGREPFEAIVREIDQRARIHDTYCVGNGERNGGICARRPDLCVVGEEGKMTFDTTKGEEEYWKHTPFMDEHGMVNLRTCGIGRANGSYVLEKSERDFEVPAYDAAAVCKPRGAPQGKLISAPPASADPPWKQQLRLQNWERRNEAELSAMSNGTTRTHVGTGDNPPAVTVEKSPQGVYTLSGAAIDVPPGQDVKTVLRFIHERVPFARVPLRTTLRMAAALWQLQYCADDTTWTDVSGSANARVALGAQFADGRYDYDLENMEQHNHTSGFTRTLRLVSRAAPSVVWSFEETAGVFCDSPALSSAIEARRAANLALDRFLLHASWSATYEVRIDAGQTTGTQLNVATGVVRKICASAPPPPPIPDYEMLDEPAGVPIPDELRCPITSVLMTQPMRTSDGFVYENAAIRAWFARSAKSPMTGLPLTDTTLTIDTPTLMKVAAFRAQSKDAVSGGEQQGGD